MRRQQRAGHAQHHPPAVALGIRAMDFPSSLISVAADNPRLMNVTRDEARPQGLNR